MEMLGYNQVLSIMFVTIIYLCIKILNSTKYNVPVSVHFLDTLTLSALLCFYSFILSFSISLSLLFYAGHSQKTHTITCIQRFGWSHTLTFSIQTLFVRTSIALTEVFPIHSSIYISLLFKDLSKQILSLPQYVENIHVQ